MEGSIVFIQKINSFDIESALKDTTRQYLIGKLSRPQELRYIEDENLEIGITSYENFQSELPHTHSQAFEYQYVLSGYTVYLDIETGKEYSFRTGDFYRISPGFKYAQKSKPNTKILFIKIPPGNDKQNLNSSSDVIQWLEQKLKTNRKDYTNNDIAPKANSIKPAAAIAILNENNEILLLRHQDSRKWTMPGGTHEFGESIADCAIRELKEETGLNVVVTGIIGTYTNPRTVIEYSDGEVRQEFTIVFSGRVEEGILKICVESTAYRWINVDEIETLELAESHRLRLKDVVEHCKKSTVFIR